MMNNNHRNPYSWSLPPSSPSFGGNTIKSRRPDGAKNHNRGIYDKVKKTVHYPSSSPPSSPRGLPVPVIIRTIYLGAILTLSCLTTVLLAIVFMKEEHNTHRTHRHSLRRPTTTRAKHTTRININDNKASMDGNSGFTNTARTEEWRSVMQNFDAPDYSLGNEKMQGQSQQAIKEEESPFVRHLHQLQDELLE